MGEEASVASRICDVEPCTKLQTALRQCLRLDDVYNPEVGPLVATLQKKTGTTDINIKYCPFCGTRLTLGMVGGLEDGPRVRRIGA